MRRTRIAASVCAVGMAVGIGVAGAGAASAAPIQGLQPHNVMFGGGNKYCRGYQPAPLLGPLLVIVCYV
ncbi:hypothetical protein HH308_02520 [Gordonia sp. TBRC 11910]|uniref:Uncharacterized protein n=1 Tax=Gordonia asplenii TaxID=2725283 RepID=A0A848KT78_9ACTN|nr:hypothetical protein [Gordonia asplenii]NMO00085.1 hypothetical protein [Gordonia asplenii]